MLVKWLATSYYDLASYQAASDQGSNTMTSNSAWVYAPNADFNLNDTSPAIDQGDTPAGSTTDFYGNSAPQGSATDIGAAESGLLVVYGGFDYTTGVLTSGNGGFGWSGDWVVSGGAGVVSVQLNTAWPSDLRYTGLPLWGNRLNIYDTDGASQTITRSFNQPMGSTTGTYWSIFSSAEAFLRAFLHFRHGWI